MWCNKEKIFLKENYIKKLPKKKQENSISLILFAR